MRATFGKPIVFGVPAETKPFRGIPEGRARLRLRNDEFAQVFVRTSTGVRRFYIEDRGDHWAAELEAGENRTIQRDKREAFSGSGLLVACILEAQSTKTR